MDDPRLDRYRVDKIRIIFSLKNPADCFSGRVFSVERGSIDSEKTNVFTRKTVRIVGNYHKNPIKREKMRENADAFVKLTKIGIEILKCFVYNVFIAALNNKTAA